MIKQGNARVVVSDQLNTVHDTELRYVDSTINQKTKEGWDRKGTRIDCHFTCFSTKGLSKKSPIVAEGSSTVKVNVLSAAGELGFSYRAFHGMITGENAFSEAQPLTVRIALQEASELRSSGH